MSVISVEAQCEADTLEEWFHNSDPLANGELYEQLVGGLYRAKGDHLAALAAHDHARAARVLEEVRDLTALCAAAAEGLSLQRRRFLASDRPWPLGRVTVG